MEPNLTHTILPARTGACLLVAMLGMLSLTLTAPVVAQDTQSENFAIEGEVSVIVEDDHDNGPGRVKYYLADPESGYAYDLKIPDGKLKNKLKSGQWITAHGNVKGDEMTLSKVNIHSAPAETGAKAAAGLRTLAVIIVNFRDATVACSKEWIAATVFPDPAQGSTNPSVADFYHQASFEQMGFDPDTNGDGRPDVFGPYTISASAGGSCDYYGWASAAESAAKSDGVNLSQYKHLLFVVPSSNTCSWAGVGNLGCGTQCRTWVALCEHSDIYAHELGHNLGMSHAGTDWNNDGAIDSEYGDDSDIMGGSGIGLREPSAAHKAQMGWFSSDSSAIQTVTQNGTYTVAPSEADPAATPLPQILKIQKTGTSYYYYLSCRTRDGYDASLAASYPDCLSIHAFTGSGKTLLIKTLSDGGTFTDGSGLLIRQVSHVAAGVNGSVTVEVNFGSVAVAAAPDIAITPLTAVATAAGSPVPYAFTVTNKDSLGMSSATFSLSGSAPSGWAVSVSPASLTLAPGASGSATLTVTPPVGVVDGTYSVGVYASASGHPAGSKTANCVVDTAPPAAPQGVSATLSKRGRVLLSWTAPSGAASYTVYRSSGGSYTQIASPSGTSLADANTKVSVNTTFYYYVVAIDSAGNASEPSNVASVLVKASGKPR